MNKQKTTTKKPEIQRLEPYVQNRKRTEMWLGSRDPHTQDIVSYDESRTPTTNEITWVPSLFTAYREVVDNAVDEMVAKGFGDRLDINYDEESLIFTIKDNGRGIPIEKHPDNGVHQATIALTELFSGRNFDDDERGATRGVNGVGASVVNSCSEWFKLDICRDGKSFSQVFSEGETALNIEKPFISPKAKGQKTGTTIEFKLSEKVFKNRILPSQFLKDRAFELALCYPRLKVYYNGEQLKALAGVEKTIFKGKKPIFLDIREDDFHSRFWLVPNFLDSNTDHSHGLVNGIPVFDGGTHINAFRRNFYSGMIKALEPTSKKKKLRPNRSDLADGMLIYNITEMDLPSFGSQAKTNLINESCSKMITSAMNDPDFYKSIVRKNPEWIEHVYERCATRTQKSDESEIAKLTKKAKKSKVAKLKDCSSRNRAETVLFLGEGDCLQENTMVETVEDNNNIISKKIKDVEIGDLVITHLGNIKRVNGKTQKVGETITVKTSFGDIVGSKDHRMFCYSKKDDTFGWVKLSDITKDHRLVRSKIPNVSGFGEISSKELLDSGDYHLIFQDMEGNYFSQTSTPSHNYGVFNLRTRTYEKVMMQDINDKEHCMLLS